jgi:hypothetical protein
MSDIRVKWRCGCEKGDDLIRGCRQ